MTAAETAPPAGDDVAQVDTLKDAMREFRRPFTAEAIKFKIQTNPKSDTSSALIVAYIDSRLVTERLNSVVPGLWSDSYASLVHSGESRVPSVMSRIKLTIGDDEVIRTDVGCAPAGDANTDMGLKGLYSDAFKRAGVKLGIGVSLYAFPQQWIKATDLGSYQGQGGKKYKLDDKNIRELRNRYRTWLEQHGEKLFGKALDHGDLEDAQGDAETEAPTLAPPDLPEFGVGAPDSHRAQMRGALKFLLGDDEAAVDEAALKIEAKFGYLPDAAAVAVGLAAGAVKARQDAAAPPQ